MIILGTNSIKDTGGYQVANSLRFNGGSSDYLNRTNATPTNQLIWTFSFWVKLSDITNAQGSGNQMLLSDFGSASNRGTIFFESDDTLTISDRVSNSFTFKYVTTRLFRDVSAWYHIVINHNRTLSTPVTKVYVNGVQETSFSTSTNPSQNGTSYFNVDGQASYVGKYGGGSEYYNGYLAEAVWIDGQALDADQFGEFDEDSGIWKPIDVSGLTFGDNGFYLDFEDSGALGADVSGNTNNFTVNNLTAIDQSTDTCTNNFATMNPLDNFWQGFAFSDGNTTVTTTNASQSYSTSSIMVSSGKWYVECKPVSGGSEPEIGVAIKMVGVNAGNNAQLSYNANGYAYRASDPGTVWYNGTAVSTGFSQYANGDIIGIALDLDNNKLYFSKNGTFGNSGDPTSGATGTGAISIVAPTSTTLGAYAFAMNETFNDQNKVFSWNFGNPAYAISSGNTDGDGYGNFEYAPPSGYLSLCTANLSEVLG